MGKPRRWRVYSGVGGVRALGWGEEAQVPLLNVQGQRKIPMNASEAETCRRGESQGGRKAWESGQGRKLHGGERTNRSGAEELERHGEG